MKVLVAGGTGRLGSRIVTDLVAKGADVRVVTRDPARAEHLPPATDVVRGDVRDADAVESAAAGVGVVVSAVHGFAGRGHVSPKAVDEGGNARLVQAAQTAGADMIMVSVVGASPDSPMELFRSKYAAEQLLRASGIDWTIIRATAFVELWAELISKGLVFGRGQNPINFVAVDDVAAVVVQAVLDRDLRGRSLDVGGPENLTFNELAALIKQLTGKPKTLHHVPRSLLRLMAPIHRQPRAALVMDTTDMTFQPLDQESRVRPTPIREALSGHNGIAYK